MKTRPDRRKRLAEIHRTIDREFPEHLARCQELLRQKSVSASGEGLRETAGMVRRYIERIGGKVEFWGDEEAPIVFGRADVGAPRTLIVYGMYDVQPAEEPGWKRPPFAAEIMNLPRLGKCLIARGAINSKGALAGVFNALSVMHRRGGLPLNLIFTVEGQEEIGSPRFEEFIRVHEDRLRADGAAEFDLSQDSQGLVTMHLGLKGIVCLDLVCQGGLAGGPTDSLHGSNSAWVSSPVWRLTHALASLTGKRENIKIKGFYENVANPSRTDSALLKKLAQEFDGKAFLKEMKSLSFKSGWRGEELLRRGLYRPVINIDGFHAGYGGRGTKTILPRKATAKIDIRFGPNMEPEEVIGKFKAHLKAKGYGDIEVTVRDSYTWSKTDYKDPLVQKMIKSYNRHGHKPQVWPMATWGAPYYAFSRVLNLPVVSGGLGHGGRQHVANEYIRVEGLRDFEKFVATFLYEASI